MSAKEQLLERLSKLATHAAIDGKIDRITEHDKEVGEQDGGIECLIVCNVNVKRILSHVQQRRDGQRNFGGQKYRHHHD